MEKEKIDWDFVMTDSEYNIAKELLKVYEAKDYEELGIALQSYFENSKSSAKLELSQLLTDLIEFVLYRKISETHQTEANREKIYYYRREIKLLFEFNDFLSSDSILEEWDMAYQHAANLVEIDFPDKIKTIKLTIEEVLEDRY